MTTMNEEAARSIIRHHLIGYGGGIRINAAQADQYIDDMTGHADDPVEAISNIAKSLQSGKPLFTDGGRMFMEWKRAMNMDHADDEAVDVDADQIKDNGQIDKWKQEMAGNNNKGGGNANVWEIVQKLANAKNQNERFKAMAQLKGLGINNLGQILGNNQPLANALMGPDPMGKWGQYLGPMDRFAGNFMMGGFLNSLPNMVNALNQGIARDMYANRDQRNFLRQGQFAEKRWDDYMDLMRGMMGNKLELGKGYLAALPDYAKALGTGIQGLNAFNPAGPQAAEDKGGIDAFAQAVEPTEVLPELAHFAAQEGGSDAITRDALGRAETEYGSEVVDPGLDASRKEFLAGHSAAAKGIHGLQGQSGRTRSREASDRASDVNRATGLAIADLTSKVNKAGLANQHRQNMIRNSMDMFNMGMPGLG